MTSGSKALLHPEYRIRFERKLKQQGLVLEYEGLDQSQDGKTCFVKIHAPWDVLTRTAEINRVKMPIKTNDLEREDRTDRWIERIFKRNPFKIEGGLAIAEPEYFTAAFCRDRMEQFLITDKETFFSQTQRIRMVWDLILRITIPMQDKFGHNVDEAVGIRFLLKEGAYVAAFPLHDGDYKAEPFDGSPPDKWPLRRWLFETWTRPSRWYKYQPLNQIRNYFGEKVAIYSKNFKISNQISKNKQLNFKK